MGSGVANKAAPLFCSKGYPFEVFYVVGRMTKIDKIDFIKSSKRKTRVYNELHRFTDNQLDLLIREIVQGLVRESEIIANAYVNGYR